MKQFFPMSKWEARLLIFVVAMAAVAFLPPWRTLEIGGMAVFGWLLAVLMIVSPALALLVFRSADRGGAGKTQGRDKRKEGQEEEFLPPDSERDPKG